MVTKTQPRTKISRKELAKFDPASIYKKPKDILNDDSLSRQEKIDILKRWAYDEREKSVADEENMLCVGSDINNRLDEILNSLIKLGVDSDQDESPPPTKHG